MSDIMTALEKALADKQNIIITFNQKTETAVYKPLFGVIIFGRMWLWSKKR